MSAEEKRITVPPGGDDAFVYVPRSLNQRHLEAVLSKAVGREVGISQIAVVNMCAGNFGGVSNSGSTVLRLTLELDDGSAMSVVAKILSPAELNLFKIDHMFDSRLAEVQWARWWGSQGVAFAPKIFDTRADRASREFWIIQEHFPQVGWNDVRVPEMKTFGTTHERLVELFTHAAELHAHSALHRDELMTLFAEKGVGYGRLCRPGTIADHLDSIAADERFCSVVSLTDQERCRLRTFAEAVRTRPNWVDGWHYVCATNDLAPDNFAFRGNGLKADMVTFDWGTACLAPMEQDVSILMWRLREIDPAQRKQLQQTYLDIYAQKTGARLEREAFEARLPWARLLHHLRMIAEHAASLRWVPHQTRSRESIRNFLNYCQELLAECDRR